MPVYMWKDMPTPVVDFLLVWWGGAGWYQYYSAWYGSYDNW